MSSLGKLLAEIMALLQASEFCENTRILETVFFSTRQFALKIRSTIFTSYTLQIRIYFNHGHFDYSYQVLDETPLCRWDNKEHFPDLNTFPHHFHTMDGAVIESSLTGNPISDLPIVLRELESYLGKEV